MKTTYFLLFFYNIYHCLPRQNEGTRQGRQVSPGALAISNSERPSHFSPVLTEVQLQTSCYRNLAGRSFFKETTATVL